VLPDPAAVNIEKERPEGLSFFVGCQPVKVLVTVRMQAMMPMMMPPI
jgi:hypothetical protein